jgi:polysaccharide chain length determinant protein (PEP-CTERM system associated)
MANVEILLLKKIGRHAWSLAWWLLGIQVLATAAGTAALKIVPKKYESSTTIRVERSQLINPLVRGLAVSSESEERIRSLREEILSRDYFEKIITRLALEPRNTPPLKHEARVQEMIKNTSIVMRQRDTFQITYTGTDPKEVRDVTNLLGGIFIEDSLSNKSGEAGSAVAFLEGQLEVYRKKLEESEFALRQFEERYADQMPSNRSAYMSRAEQLRATLTELQNNLRQAKIQRDLLREQAAPSGSQPEEGVGSGALMVPNPLAMQIREKEAQMRRLLVDYSETYPDVVALRSEIAGLQKELEKNPTVPASQAMTQRQPSVQDALSLGQLQQIELQIGALETREMQLTQDLARFERKVQAIPEVEQQMAALRRDYDVNNDIYNSILRRLEEAKVSRELEASKKGEVFRILQAAVLPLTPSRPTRLQTVLLGVAAGLGLNALLVFLFAQLDTSIQSAEEAKKFLDLRVLAGIPRHLSRKQISARRLKSAALLVSCVVYAGSVGAFLFWDRVVNLIRKGL